METSSFLYDNLSYGILIWLHFGTNMLISYSYVFYVFPILYNIFVMILPHFNFGFIKQKAGGAGSGATVIPADLNKTLNDSKIFAHAYSRNPKLFSSLPIQEVGTFFSGLDEKLTSISSVLKDFPVAEEATPTSVNGGGSSGNFAGGTGGFEGGAGESDGGDDKKSKKGKSKKDGDEKSSKSSIKSLLLYGNLVFLVAIIGINAFGYFQFNSLFNEYFVLKKGMFKYSDSNYELDYKKVRTLKDKEKSQMLSDINNYVQMINSAKSEKFRREKMEELKGKGKNQK